MSPVIGLVSDCPLVLFDLQALLADSGYLLGFACAPERLSEATLSNEQVDACYVSLSRDYESDLLIDLLADADVPVLIDETIARDQRVSQARRWKMRVLEKLAASALPERSMTRCESREMASLLHRAGTTSARQQPARSVWVLGASLGGPEAMVDFLSCLPASVPASLVYAQHIDDYCTETLVQVMSRKTALGVRMLADGDILTHGEVGVVPVTAALEFTQRGKVVVTSERWQGPFAPSIDQVSIAVARVYRERAGFIVFSGMGNDGAAACSEVKRYGGQVWVQDPSSCVCSAMPDSALASGCVERSAAPRSLAGDLLDYHMNPVKSGIEGAFG